MCYALCPVTIAHLLRVFSMLRLQETKTGLAEAALGEGGGVKLHKLSVKELKDVSI